MLKIDIQRGNWSGGKEESIGNWLKLRNQVREANLLVFEITVIIHLCNYLSAWWYFHLSITYA